MENKKVLMIPPVSVFKRYARARDGMLRIAVYSERSFPLDAVQKRFANISRLGVWWGSILTTAASVIIRMISKSY